MSATDQEYYGNSENWGENQYLTLQNIIDNIRLTADDDSYFKNAKKFRCLIFGKKIVKDLNVDIKSQSKAIAIDVPPSRIFPFPRYMLNWSVVSVINKCGKLQELNISNVPTIKNYLQDSEFHLIYDCNGTVMEGDTFNADKGDCFIKRECLDTIKDNCGCQDTSFEKSWVKENKEGHYFEFSNDLVGQSVVIEFQSAGLQDLDACDVKVHLLLEDTVSYYIKWKLLEGQRNIPMNEVLYHKNLYDKAKDKSENLLGDKISINQILNSISLRY